jgi:hypothetical protein
MAGYSGTPLPKKLGFKERYRVAMVDAPDNVRAALRETLAQCEVSEKAPLDLVMLFATKEAELQKQFSRWAKRLSPAGMLWISWPKKTSGVASDLNENRIREIGLDTGLVDVKVCAVTEIWSGLKFVRRIKDRK